MPTLTSEHAQMSDELIDLHIAHLDAARKSKRTIDARRSVLKRLYRQLPFGLAYAATEQIEAWLAAIRNTRSEWTLSIYHYHVTQFYRWACRAGFLDGDPTLTIETPRHPQSIPNPVTEDELARALGLPEPWRTAVILAGFEGMRASEIAACHRDHLTPEMVTIPHGKGDKYGTVPMHPFVWGQLKDRPSGPFFLDNWGQPVDGHWLTVHIRKPLDRAGLGRDPTGARVHLHRLRHRYGTSIQDLTGDIRVTQECLRHAHVTSTQGYTLVTPGRKAAAVAGLPVPEALGNTHAAIDDVQGKHEPAVTRLVPPAAEAA